MEFVDLDKVLDELEEKEEAFTKLSGNGSFIENGFYQGSNGAEVFTDGLHSQADSAICVNFESDSQQVCADAANTFANEFQPLELQPTCLSNTISEKTNLLNDTTNGTVTVASMLNNLSDRNDCGPDLEANKGVFHIKFRPVEADDHLDVSESEMENYLSDVAMDFSTDNQAPSCDAQNGTNSDANHHALSPDPCFRNLESSLNSAESEEDPYVLLAFPHAYGNYQVFSLSSGGSDHYSPTNTACATDCQPSSSMLSVCDSESTRCIDLGGCECGEFSQRKSHEDVLALENGVLDIPDNNTVYLSDPSCAAASAIEDCSKSNELKIAKADLSDEAGVFNASVSNYDILINDFANASANELIRTAISTLVAPSVLLSSSQTCQVPQQLNAIAVPVPEQGFENKVAQESVTAVLPSRCLISSTHDLGVQPELRLTDAEMQLGKSAPMWIPDQDSNCCLLCLAKFSMIKRRHHCRACGRVLCFDCCNRKSFVPYMEKEARVCSFCENTLKKIADYENSQNAESVSSVADPNPLFSDAQNDNAILSTDLVACSSNSLSSHQNNTIAVDATMGSKQRTRLVSNAPVVGVLKHEKSEVPGFHRNREKNVMFSDGIKPGGDLFEFKPPAVAADGFLPEFAVNSASSAHNNRTASRTKSRRARRRSNNSVKETELECLISENNWPPHRDYEPRLSRSSLGNSVQSHSDELVHQFKYGKCLSFFVKRNLIVSVSLTSLDCCVKTNVWAFSSSGLCFVGQEEIIILLEAQADEDLPPVAILNFYNNLYDESYRGTFVGELDYSLFPSEKVFANFGDSAGFLYIRPSFQCLKNLVLPEPPFLVGLLINRWELPWAKVLPQRLILRLGAEYAYYPCPLISCRHRKSMFFEIGHTIMSLLSDFRSYTYSLPTIPSSIVRFLDQETVVILPSHKYKQVLKIINSSNEHVLAFGSGFDREADSHLVCIQQENGSYQSQIITMQDLARKVTGACFVVFNGSLKTGILKSSIVEDGVMIQMKPDAMEALKDKLRSHEDYSISCDSGESTISLTVRWAHHQTLGDTAEEQRSPIDGLPYSSFQMAVRYDHSADFRSDNHVVRLTEMFLNETNQNGMFNDPGDYMRLGRLLCAPAQAALLAFASQLLALGAYRIGLRFTLSPEMGEYSAGTGASVLSVTFMEALDDALVPVIHEHTAGLVNDIVLELLLYIFEI